MSTRTAKPRAVRCVCKNRDRHFGVCKCHRHKGDTVADLSLSFDERVAVTTSSPEALAKPPAERIDAWWCAQCKAEWTVPSLPHNPACPRCGRGGWWRRFA